VVGYRRNLAPGEIYFFRLAPMRKPGSVWPARQRRVSAAPSPMQRARDAGASALAPTPEERGSQSPQRRRSGSRRIPCTPCQYRLAGMMIKASMVTRRVRSIGPILRCIDAFGWGGWARTGAWRRSDSMALVRRASLTRSPDSAALHPGYVAGLGPRYVAGCRQPVLRLGGAQPVRARARRRLTRSPRAGLIEQRRSVDRLLGRRRDGEAASARRADAGF
jgi:hypothetical protein